MKATKRLVAMLPRGLASRARMAKRHAGRLRYRMRQTLGPVNGDVELLLAQHDDPSLHPGDLWLDRRAGNDQTAALLSALDRPLAAGGVRTREGMEVAWIAIGASGSVASGANGLAGWVLEARCGREELAS